MCDTTSLLPSASLLSFLSSFSDPEIELGPWYFLSANPKFTKRRSIVLLVSELDQKGPAWILLSPVASAALLCSGNIRERLARWLRKVAKPDNLSLITRPTQ